MRNRLLLIGLTIGAWIFLKALDFVVPGPELLFLLTLIIVAMTTHSAWLLLAQSRWRKRGTSMLAPIPFDKTAVQTTPGRVWQPSVDIFISAKNESRVIESCVRKMFQVDYPDYMVWIIDDNSTDSMPQILEKLQSEFPRLRVHRKTGTCPGKSAALNEALALSKGEVVAVFDADAYIAPDFFQRVLPVLEPEGIGAIQAQKRIYEHQTGFLVNCQASEYALDTYFQMGRDLIGGAVELRGNGELIKRTALIDVGGWNNKAITDDLDLTMRLLISNWDVRFCPEAFVWEEGVTTLKSLIRQRCRWAEGSIRRYLDYIFPLNSPRRLSFTERIDTLAFTVFFSVPAIMFMEAMSEVFQYLAGQTVHPTFLLLSALAIGLLSQINMLIAIRIYRPKMSFLRAFFHSFEVIGYIYLHWVPCVLLSIGRILTRDQATTWQRTEHAGHLDLHSS
jgi:1,2-diacylglycerol 3-beta-glucosyltransferase